MFNLNSLYNLDAKWTLVSNLAWHARGRRLESILLPAIW
jgi:hypothetical protein